MSMENSGWDEMQNVFFAGDAIRPACWDDNGVPGVRTSLVACDDVNILTETIDDLPFSFITPLSADDDLNRHELSSR
jgi:hypothetical protein